MDITGIFEDQFGLCTERIIVTWDLGDYVTDPWEEGSGSRGGL